MVDQNNSKKRFGFSSQYRLKSSLQFDKVFQARRSISDGHLILFARPNNLGHCRIGLGVGKKVGGAVQRNDYKRRLREAFRLSQHELKGSFDLVVVPRAKKRICVSQYQKSIVHLFRRLQKRIEKK